MNVLDTLDSLDLTNMEAVGSLDVAVANTLNLNGAGAHVNLADTLQGNPFAFASAVLSQPEQPPVADDKLENNHDTNHKFDSPAGFA